MSEPWIKYEVAPLGPLWAWGVFVADANDHREAGKRQPWRLADHGVERLRNLAEGLAESRLNEIRSTVVELLEKFAADNTVGASDDCRWVGADPENRPWSVVINGAWGTEEASFSVYVSGTETKLSTPEFERQTVAEFCASALATIGPGERR